MRSFLALLLFLAASRLALAAPTQLRLSIVGDARTSMGVAWTTPDNVASVVEVRRVGTTTAVSTTGAGAQDVTGVGFVHTVTVQGLTAATDYEYRVGDGASDWSAWRPFTTGPNTCDPWSFIALGDDRADPVINSGRGVSPRWGPIAEEAAAGTPKPGLFINSGDLVYSGSDAAQWTDWLTTSEPVTSIIPHMPVLGNHDASGTENAYLFNDVFFLPRNDVVQSEDFYAYRYGNALFIAFTTASNDQGTATDPRPFAKQAAWMRSVLEQNTDAVWRIVYLHHPSFTVGGADLFGFALGHPSNEKLQNEVLLPLLDEFHVDFVVAGHNHWYERLEAVRQGTTLTEGMPAAGPDDGTQHIVSGGAGAITVDFDIGGFNPINIVCANVKPGQVQCTGEHHYVRFDIHGRSISVKTHATACQNDNCNHTPTVMDEFSYTKAGADPCAQGSSSSSSGAPSSSSSVFSSSAAVVVSSSSSASSLLAPSSAAPPSSSQPRSSSVAAVSQPGSSAVAGASTGDGSDAAAPGNCGCQTTSTGGWGFTLLALFFLLRGCGHGRARR